MSPTTHASAAAPNAISDTARFAWSTLGAVLIATLGYVAVAVPGRWLSDQPPIAWNARQLALVRGSGGVIGDALVVTTSESGGSRRIAGGLFGAAACLFVVMTRTNVTLFGHALHLDFAPQWTSFGERMLLLDNWHLLWYAGVVVLAVGTRGLRSPALRPLALMVGGGLAFAFVVFALPTLRTWFAEPTANRTFLIVAPLTAALVALLARDWTLRWQEAPRDAHPANR